MRTYLLFLLLAAQVALAQEAPKMGEVKLPTGAERRLALVIAMSEYKYVRPLKNPPNDADDMVVALEQLGFKKENIVVIKNQGLGYVQSQIDLFMNSFRANDVVFFYFSGHGMGYNGDNYLLPIDARLDCLEEIPKFGISVNTLQAAFRGRGVRNNFLVLDACRNLDKNIYSCQLFGKTATTAKGLMIPQNQLEGDAIIYATQQGEEADDNVQQRNGLFTQMLLKYLVLPDLSFFEIVSKTTEEVLEESKRRVAKQQMKARQLPAMYGSLGLKFVFVKSPPKPDQVEAIQRRQAELEAENARLAAALKNATVQPDNTRVTPPTADLSPFMTMVKVQGGTFKRYGYEITVSTFTMGKYEVTVEQFAAFVAATNYRTDAEKIDGSYIDIDQNGTLKNKAGINWRHDEEGKIRPNNQYNHPVIHVSWNDAVAFCEWLSRKEGKTYRLPTEAEWEYAAGGGSQSRTIWAGTDTESQLAMVGNFCDINCNERSKNSKQNDKYKYTAPVGIFKANGLGLHDLSGNIWEWCNDWYGDYPRQSETNPKGSATGTYRVLRGGSWYNTPSFARVANRLYSPPDYRNNRCGFRVVSPSQ